MRNMRDAGQSRYLRRLPVTPRPLGLRANCAFPRQVGKRTQPRNVLWGPVRSTSQPVAQSGQLGCTFPQLHLDCSVPSTPCGSPTPHPEQAGRKLPHCSECAQRYQVRPSWPCTRNSRPPHSPHSWTSWSDPDGWETPYAGSFKSSLTKADGRAFDARIVRVRRARVIATYITRRSSAFWNASSSGDTNPSKGSSTI